MKGSEERKAHLPINGMFYMACISIFIILSFFIFSGPGYGSTDVPATIHTTPVTAGASALFAGSDGGSAPANLGIRSAFNGAAATFTLVAGFDDEKAVHTETLLDIKPVNRAVHTTHAPCQNSCSL